MIALREISRVVNGQLYGEDGIVESFSIDSRKMPEQGMFVALKGERVDGHDYAELAANQGAVAALVERQLDEANIPQVVVADARQALIDLASHWRKQFSGKLIAITGSNGKTTVKEMVASILSQCGPTLATQGNLNNDLGVPLTLLRLRPDVHQYAVIEMGANHVGEIAHLCQIAQPEISLINNVGAAHLEGFGSIEDIVIAKSEIYAGLKANGVAVINGDDAHKNEFINNAAGHPQIIFSCHESADVMGERLSVSTRGRQTLLLKTASETVEVDLPLLGQHNFHNAVAAAAVSLTAGAGLDAVKQGLEMIKPVPGRLNVKAGVGGCVVIDDTYNANPSSCQAAIEVLAAYSGKKIFVLGDMGELGEDACALHKQVGQQAFDKGIDEMYGVGQLSHAAVDAFPVGRGYRFAGSSDAIHALLTQAKKETIILVKGSRFMKMERIVEAITERDKQAEC